MPAAAFSSLYAFLPPTVDISHLLDKYEVCDGDVLWTVKRRIEAEIALYEDFTASVTSSTSSTSATTAPDTNVKGSGPRLVMVDDMDLKDDLRAVEAIEQAMDAYLDVVRVFVEGLREVLPAEWWTPREMVFGGEYDQVDRGVYLPAYLPLSIKE